jgi:hypothetical protein
MLSFEVDATRLPVVLRKSRDASAFKDDPRRPPDWGESDFAQQPSLFIAQNTTLHKAAYYRYKRLRFLYINLGHLTKSAIRLAEQVVDCLLLNSCCYARKRCKQPNISSNGGTKEQGIILAIERREE